MKKSDFYYDLPPELIAQTPIPQRDHSRLLTLDKATGEITHRHFFDIVDIINPGDCLILNDTRVLPARLYGKRQDTGAVVEFVLLKQIQNAANTVPHSVRNRRGDRPWSPADMRDIEDDAPYLMDGMSGCAEGDCSPQVQVWECIAGPGKKARQGHVFSFGDGLLTAKVADVLDNGNRVIEFYYEHNDNASFFELLDKLGEMPLPHYITQRLDDKERYQTVYAKEPGSAAAPTAGLHFTPEILDALRQKDVNIGYVTLHVGLGTFRPVKAENIEDHVMHEESYSISGRTAELINRTKQNGGRVIAVGTTSCRTLESSAQQLGMIRPCSGNTGIFIYPGYQFKCIDALITNFHLPESTLIMLVSAFAGKENTFAAYHEAIRERYRFFSFGDAMFIL